MKEAESGEESPFELFESDDEVNPRRKAFIDDEGHPIWFHIHSSISRVWVVNNLTHYIQKHGGVVRPDDDRVDTVLVDERKINKEQLQRAYDSSFDRERRTIWVEPISFIQHCIKQGFVRHRLPTKFPMGGRTPGTRLVQTPFTDEDDNNLARHLALRLPDKEAGGRKGNKIYQNLVALADEPGFSEYEWVRRHTWHSWRNRYNKDQDRFDPLIAHYVELEEPAVKHHFPYDRRMCRTYTHRPQDDLWEGYDEHNPQVLPSTHKSVPLNRPRAPPVKRTEARPGQPSGSGSQISVADTNTDYKALFGDSEDDEPPPVRQPTTFGNEYQSASQQFLSEPQATQTTLVASTPQLRPPRPRPRPSTSYTLPQRFGNTFESSPPNGQLDNDFPRNFPVTPSHSNTEVLDPVRSHILQSQSQSTTTGPRINLNLASDRGRRRAVKVASQPVTPPPVLAIAPYLNTRARSNMPGPSDAAEKTRKAARVPSMTLLPEAPNEDDVQTLDSQNVSNASAPTREAQDEMSVENLLVNESTEGSRRIEEGQSGTAPLARVFSTPATPESPDSDDKKTGLALHQPPPAYTSQHQVSDLPEPDEMLKKFDDNAPSHFSRRDRARFTAPVPSHAAFATSTPRLGIELNEQGSVTSDESFPLPGTSASAAKRKIEAGERQTLYKAPFGTRAAKYASNQ